MTSWLPLGVEPQRGQYRFRVSDAEDGSPWIYLEPAGDTIEIVGRKGGSMHFGFTLRPGKSHDDAKLLAGVLNSEIAELTMFEVPETLA